MCPCVTNKTTFSALQKNQALWSVFPAKPGPGDSSSFLVDLWHPSSRLTAQRVCPWKNGWERKVTILFGSFWVSWNLPTKGAPQRLSASARRRVWPELSSLQESLQKLSFGHGFNRSLEKATLPKNLHALYLGSSKKKRLSCPQCGNLRMHYKRCITSCRFSTKMLDNDVFVDIYWKISFSWISLVLVHDIIYVYL